MVFKIFNLGVGNGNFNFNFLGALKLHANVTVQKKIMPTIFSAHSIYFNNVAYFLLYAVKNNIRIQNA